jgi:23S rRNA (cytosine1962-C5)-methyltransferase
MEILTTDGWENYELIDSGNGKRLERFGQYRLVRPDPQILWRPYLESSEWEKADAVFEEGIGKWIVKTEVPGKWIIKYKDLSFYAKLSPFKHTGVFPEQRLQWDFIEEKMQGVSYQPNILNLFAYTGIASLVAAKNNAKVTHVDASKPTIGWARENQEVSGLQDKPIRYILDDAIKFTRREIKRGVKYDAVIMDPPVYGHGPEGEKWEFAKNFPELLNICVELLTDKPLFFIINAYAISCSALLFENMLSQIEKKFGGKIEVGELVLEEKENRRKLSTGIFGRWSK